MKISFRVLLLLIQLLFATTVFAFQSFIVNKISVKGLNRVSRETVLQAISIKPGDTLRSAYTSKIINEVFKTGFFRDVTLSKDGSVLIINVIERPIITEFNITGIKDKKNIEKILREHNVAQGRMLICLTLASSPS